MPKGILGLNCRTLGVSRDQTISAVRNIDCAFVLVHDDPALAAQAKAEGCGVLYRQSGDDANGNPLAQDPAAFVAERARNAPTADFIHLSNEIDAATPQLLAWTRAAMQHADRIGRKVCLLNFSTNRDAATWNACQALIREAVAGGHAIGLHAYFDGSPEHDAGAWAWRDLKRAVGGLWMVTEFAFIRDIRDGGKGWRHAIGPAQYAAFFQLYVPRFTVEQMPLCLFAFDDWPDWGKEDGFGVWNAPDVLASVASVNRNYEFKGANPMSHVNPPITGGVKAALAKLPGAYVNVRAEPDAGSADQGDLFRDTVVIAYLSAPVNGWVYVEPAPGAVNAAGWVSLQGGAVQFVPELLPTPTPTPVPEPEPTIAVPLPVYNQMYTAWKMMTDAMEGLPPTPDGSSF